MLKKIITASLIAGSLVIANAQSAKSIIKAGFYVNVGLAFPAQTLDVTSGTVESTSFDNVTSGSITSTTNIPAQSLPSQTLGTMPSIEIGNQWYFWKMNSMGIGIRASWFQFGYSSYSLNSSNLNPGLVDMRFVKVAPQFTYALTDDMALDFSFEVAPTVMLGAASKDNYTYAYVSGGLLYAPGIKFRYKIFAVGFDYGFGSLTTRAVITDDNSSTGEKSVTTYKGNASTSYPRVYLGFKF